VTEVWTVVGVVGAATMAFKALGPVGLADRELPPRLASVLGLLAPAVLAALVVTSAAGDGWRVLGLGAAAIAILLRAPLLLVVVIAAVVAAGARALT
jgi:branched chain amino acid efflux pump